MKLLINFCAHDGIISHYAGVGTIVRRYIKTLKYVLDYQKIDFDLNLFAPYIENDSLGYSEKVYEENKNQSVKNIYFVDNGTNGKMAYGNIKNWKQLCNITSTIINSINISDYDIVINIANDTPFAGLAEKLKENNKSKFIWIPHSTVKIHEVDSSIESYEEMYNERLEWEKACISKINITKNYFVGSTGKYIENHLINEYNLLENKSLYIPNGETLFVKNQYNYDEKTFNLFKDFNSQEPIILSFARAEEYKNLDGTILLGRNIGIKSIVIVQEYFEGQELTNKLRNIAKDNNSELIVNPPFSLPQYIVENYSGNIVMLIPSKKEIVGLVINEMRRFNKDNVLIVANDIGGMSEQITTGYDGVLVDMNDLAKSTETINKYFHEEKMKELNLNAQKTLKEKYDFEITIKKVLKKLIGGYYE